MKRFFEHWKRGWKLLLMDLCFKFAYVLMLLPIAIIILVVLKLRLIVYHVIWITVFIVFVPAVTHYIFELFYGPEKPPAE